MITSAPSGKVGMNEMMSALAAWGPHRAAMGGAQPGAERL
jgi:hypothetical protein